MKSECELLLFIYFFTWIIYTQLNILNFFSHYKWVLHMKICTCLDIFGRGCLTKGFIIFGRNLASKLPEGSHLNLYAIGFTLLTGFCNCPPKLRTFLLRNLFLFLHRNLGGEFRSQLRCSESWRYLLGPITSGEPSELISFSGFWGIQLGKGH